TVQLIGLKLFKEIRRTSLRHSLKFRVKESLRLLGKKYGYDLLNDYLLLRGLQDHLERVIYPLKHNVDVHNMFLKHIKSEYIQAYQMAVVFSNILSNSISLYISENEVGYIALHIEAAIE